MGTLLAYCVQRDALFSVNGTEFRIETSDVAIGQPIGVDSSKSKGVVTYNRKGRSVSTSDP